MRRYIENREQRAKTERTQTTHKNSLFPSKQQREQRELQSTRGPTRCYSDLSARLKSAARASSNKDKQNT